MLKQIICLACFLLLQTAIAIAADKGNDDDGDAKVVSGMSIVGNDETPKSLVIVPWKNTEIIQESQRNSELLSVGMDPVDKASFMRDLELYKLNHPD